MKGQKNDKLDIMGCIACVVLTLIHKPYTYVKCKDKVVYEIFFRYTDDFQYVVDYLELAKISCLLNEWFNIKLHENDKSRYEDCVSYKISNKAISQKGDTDEYYKTELSNYG